MTRVVEVAGMRIQIDQELQAGVDEPEAIDNDFYGALQYISQDQYDCGEDVDAVLLRSGQAKFTARVTVLNAVDPDEVPLWTVGFAQNVATYNRYAFYGPGIGVQVTENFEYGGALRDGEIGTSPFYELGGGTSEQLELGQQLDIACEDAPGWVLPLAIDGRGVNASLRKTTGGNSFATWLMLARMTETERQVVLLGRVTWSTQLAAEAGPDGGMHWTAPAVPSFDNVVPLDQRYDADTIPPVSDGEDVPDLRVLEGHTYIQGHLSQNIGDQHPVLVEWVYTANECATPWQRFPNPATVPNWLEGETPGGGSPTRER